MGSILDPRWAFLPSRIMLLLILTRNHPFCSCRGPIFDPGWAIFPFPKHDFPFPHAEFPLWALSRMQNFPFSTRKWPPPGGHFGSIFGPVGPFFARSQGAPRGPGVWRPFRRSVGPDSFCIQFSVSWIAFFRFFFGGRRFLGRARLFCPCEPATPEIVLARLGAKKGSTGGGHLARAPMYARRRTRRSMLSSFYILIFQKGTFWAPWQTRFSTEVEGCHLEIEKSTPKKEGHFGGHFGPPGGGLRPILGSFLTPFFDPFLVLPG